LYNGLGRYADAAAAAKHAIQEMPEITAAMFALPELIEAAVRTGDTELAAHAVDEHGNHPAGRNRLGTGDRSALPRAGEPGQAAEDLYREAIDRFGRTRLRSELARAHLLYGEWPTRCWMRSGWRPLPNGLGGSFWPLGETARKRTAQAADQGSQPLTAQETQVALLARDGLTNPEIGARLFISTHTVQYHLGKVFAKLGISSRGRLHRVLPGSPDTPGR
jgi:DNA-binding CsgD family transcriptional regulator